MDFTITLSEKFNALPFEIFKQDKDEVIMLINYYIEKGNSTQKNKNLNNDKQEIKRVRVDDNSCTGGWF